MNNYLSIYTFDLEIFKKYFNLEDLNNRHEGTSLLDLSTKLNNQEVSYFLLDQPGIIVKRAIKHACSNNNLKLVEKMLQFNNCLVLPEDLVNTDDLVIQQYLLDKCKFSNVDVIAEKAIHENDKNLMKAILKYYDPSQDWMIRAVLKDSDEIVKSLLERLEPCKKSFYVIKSLQVFDILEPWIEEYIQEVAENNESIDIISHILFKYKINIPKVLVKTKKFDKFMYIQEHYMKEEYFQKIEISLKN